MAGFALAIVAGAAAFVGGLASLDRPIDVELKSAEGPHNVTPAALGEHSEAVLDRYDDCIVNAAAIC